MTRLSYTVTHLIILFCSFSSPFFISFLFKVSITDKKKKKKLAYLNKEIKEGKDFFSHRRFNIFLQLFFVEDFLQYKVLLKF